MTQLAGNKKFWPLFWTQFLGALNDNVFKNALVVLVTFKGISVAGLDSASVVALSGGLFIFPFFLFSPIAGQLSDKYQKAKLVRFTKIAEIAIMTLAGVGFWSQNPVLLLATLFFAGLQAALFGPVKYSLLPDLVEKKNLIAANAYIELGTFLAILIGTICGGILISLEGGAALLIAVLIALAVSGFLTSLLVKDTPVAEPELVIEKNPFPSIVSTLRILRRSEAIWNSVLGISWFWFFGGAVLSVLPVYCKDFLGVNEHVVTCFLAMFTVGIGIGSIACEKLSFQRVELGLVPVGSVGMTGFLVALFWTRPEWSPNAAQLMTLTEFLHSSAGPWLLFYFLMVSVFGGLFILPLYTLIQERSHPSSRSRVIAGNNIVNAIFMVASALLVMGLHALKVTEPQVFLILGGLNLLVAIYIYTIVPEFTLRFLAWVVARLLYRIKIVGEEQIPAKGAAVLICNHMSYVDWLIIFALARRPVRFVMYYKFFEIPVARFLMKQAKVIPIANSHENPELLAEAYERISEELAAGEIICIFPEGKISRDGQLNEFKTGIEKIIARDPVPILPTALRGLWGTFFSFGEGKPLRKLPTHWLSRVELVVGEPIAPINVTAADLSQEVRALLGSEAEA